LQCSLSIRHFCSFTQGLSTFLIIPKFDDYNLVLIDVLNIYILQTLTFLKKSGPSLDEVIPDGYSRCLVAGLLSPRLSDIQPSSLSQVRWCFLTVFFLLDCMLLACYANKNQWIVSCPLYIISSCCLGFGLGGYTSKVQ
jgi:hypothetical protein